MYGFRLMPVRHGNPRNEEISQAGDSGSIWYSKQDGKRVGLHIAGETNRHPAKEHAIACYLNYVLDDLDVSLVPKSDDWETLNEALDDEFDHA